jgi:hypothetical protein
MLDDIKSYELGMPIASFILAVCFIDQVSGFVYDNNLPGQKDGTSRSKKFVEEYLNKVAAKPYNKNDLIELLRNKLVHNYSLHNKDNPTQVKYLLEWKYPILHLHPSKHGILINLEKFINELEAAFNIYKIQLQSDAGIQKLAIDHYDQFEILFIMKLKLRLI